MGMESRVSRLAKNEALFRDVNDRLAKLTNKLASSAAYPLKALDGLVCECSDPLCLERIEPLPITQYEAVRHNPVRFIVVPGHESPDVKTIERHPTYWVVEKDEGLASDVARELDPRN